MPSPPVPPQPMSPLTVWPPAQTYGQQPAAPAPQSPYQPYAQPVPWLANAPAALPELKGTGGWLLFFTLSLIILGPLWELFMILVGLILVGQYQNNTFVAYFMLDSLIRIGMGVTGVVMGVRLWNQKPGSLKWARRFLLFILIPCAFLSGILPLGYPSASMPATVITVQGWVAFVTIAAAVAWFSYLKKSRRVAATYPQG
jgi:hypothetical protein